MSIKTNNLRMLAKLSVACSAVAVLFSASSCKQDPLSPGVEYMPDMYRGPAHETYSEAKWSNGETVLTARTPASGSIPRGYEPYGYPNTPEGYELAGQNVKSPITSAEDIKKAEEDGKVLFTKYCVHCHGEKGDGQGSIKVKGDAFPVPSYYDEGHKNVPEGKFYHTLMYGKGLMGSHASQVNQTERWKLLAYVNKLRKEGMGIKDGAMTSAPADSTVKTTKP